MSRSWSFLWTSLLWLIVVTGCGANPDEGSLEGVVEAAATGDPVAGAEVRIDRHSDTTDDDGIFRIEGVEQGSRVVSVRHEDLGSAIETVEIRPRQTTAIVVQLNTSDRAGAVRPGASEGGSSSGRSRDIGRPSTAPPAAPGDPAGGEPSSPGTKIEFGDLGQVCDAEDTTFVCLASQSGDSIGGGRDLLLTAENSKISWRRNYDGGLSISILGDDHWSLDFAPPEGEELVPGRYTGAHRFPFQGSRRPGLSVVGAGRGCNTLTGSFEILMVHYDRNGDVDAFAADFEQHCDGRGPALLGRVFINVEKGDDAGLPRSREIQAEAAFLLDLRRSRVVAG